MTEHVPVHRLFETHLTVSDLQRSIGFYRDVVGLRLAFEATKCNVASSGSVDPCLVYGRSV